MKKCLMVLLAGLICFSFAGCGEKKQSAGQNSTATSATTEPDTGEAAIEQLLQVGANNKMISKDGLNASIIRVGNLARLAKVMEKAQRGDAITIGFIGGSITEGMRSSAVNKRYGDIVTKWWKTTFPSCKVQYVNAGIGSTGSLIGVNRMAGDLLARNPDFVVVEYACNDTNSALDREAYEGVIRRILKQSNDPAVMLLFMMKQDGTNVQDGEIIVGNKYDLPMISYRDAIQYEIDNNGLKWSDISPDAVHPNDKGHQIAADLIINRLNSAKEHLSSINTNILALPATETRFMAATLYNNKTLVANSLGAFTAANSLYPNAVLANGWVATARNKPLVFETESQVVTVLFKRLVMSRGATAEVLLDGVVVMQLVSDFQGGFGEYADLKTVINRTEKTKVTVEIRLINDAKTTADSQFVLLGIMQS